MRFSKRFLVIFIFLVIASLFMVSCGEKKQGKVTVTEHEFEIIKDSELGYSLNVKGKIKNTGEVDVKKVVVTGYCKSCGEIFTSGNWFVSDLEKTLDQQAMVNFLAPGEEVDFSFKGVAFYYIHAGGEAPEVIPDKINIVIESFETVN